MTGIKDVKHVFKKIYAVITPRLHRLMVIVAIVYHNKNFFIYRSLLSFDSQRCLVLNKLLPFLTALRVRMTASSMLESPRFVKPRVLH